jgi:hypothetical protein
VKGYNLDRNTDTDWVHYEIFVKPVHAFGDTIRRIVVFGRRGGKSDMKIDQLKELLNPYFSIE